MKKLAALVLALVLSMSLFTTAAMAGDEPLYEADEIALELEKIFGYKSEVTLKIQDNSTLEGPDVVYFEVYNPVREDYYYWDAECIFGQYVLTEESFWEMVDTYPSWEQLPWESTQGRHFLFERGAQNEMSKLIGEMSIRYTKLDEDSMEILLTVGEEEFCRVLEYGEFVEVDGVCIVEQSVLTDLYWNYLER